MSRTNTFKLAFVVAALSSFAAITTADAATSTTISGCLTCTGYVIGSATFKPSSKVTVGVIVGATGGAACDASATTCNEFAASAKHDNGPKSYITNNTDSKIYWKTTTAIVNPTASNQSFTDTATWTAM